MIRVLATVILHIGAATLFLMFLSYRLNGGEYGLQHYFLICLIVFIVMLRHYEEWVIED